MELVDGSGKFSLLHAQRHLATSLLLLCQYLVLVEEGLEDAKAGAKYRRYCEG